MSTACVLRRCDDNIIIRGTRAMSSNKSTYDREMFNCRTANLESFSHKAVEAVQLKLDK